MTRIFFSIIVLVFSFQLKSSVEGLWGTAQIWVGNINQDKDTISLDDLRSCAAKFFWISRITPEGNYAVKICRSLSEVMGNTSACDSRLLDFSFSVIQKYYNSGDYNMIEELRKEILKIYKVSLSEDVDSRLLMAQGALYVLMSTNEVLLQALQYEYETRQEKLDFVVLWEASRAKVRIGH